MRPRWQIVTLDPLRLLVWAAATAATGCYGLAALWILSGSWYVYLQWELGTLATAALLTIAATVGDRVLR